MQALNLTLATTTAFPRVSEGVLGAQWKKKKKKIHCNSIHSQNNARMFDYIDHGISFIFCENILRSETLNGPAVLDMKKFESSC